MSDPREGMTFSYAEFVETQRLFGQLFAQALLELCALPPDERTPQTAREILVRIFADREKKMDIPEAAVLTTILALESALELAALDDDSSVH